MSNKNLFNISPVARVVPFDKTGTNFTTDNVQEAIIEARSIGNFQIATDNTETSTTSSTTYSVKLTLTTPSLLEGNYRLGWVLKWRAANANRGIQLRIRQDSTTIKEYILFTANVNETPFTAAFAQIENLTAGVHTFDLSFRVGIGSTTVYVSEANLEFWRTD